MKHFSLWIAVILMALPAICQAQKKSVDEYGEEIKIDPSVIEQVPLAETPKAVKKQETKKGGPVEERDIGSQPKPTVSMPAPQASSRPTALGRNHRFQVGLAGPSVGYASHSVGAFMAVGVEGEYFFFEKLSAGLRIEVDTKFKDPTILDFTPRVRYFFDFDRFPRWTAYVQAGMGAAIYRANGWHAAADIAIPGGGFWWQYTNNWSFGADTSLHIFVLSDYTTIGFTFGPTFRYMF